MSLYEPALSGDGWEIVPCLGSVSRNIRKLVDDGHAQLTFLGAYPSREHQIASPNSLHNPKKAPNGKTYVCGLDTGGLPTDVAKLAYYIQKKYREKHPVLYYNGFTQWGDGYGLEWGTGDREWTGNDIGHNHINPTVRNNYANGNWWVDALADDTFGDDLEDYWLNGHTTAGAAGAPIVGEEDMTKQEHDMLEAVYNRLMARTDGSGPQWIVKNDKNVWVPTTNANAKAPDGTPARLNGLLDELNGQTLRQEIVAGNVRLDDLLSEVGAIKAKVGA